jgi:formylglycine-generating enzyme required for sulfatase activity
MAQARQKGELAAVKTLRDQVRRAMSDLEQERIESLDRFQTEFEALIARYVLPRGYLVVFVDDLDRCLPDKAVEVLEAIKLFLDVSGCIFVLGLDSEAVEQAVRTRYRGEVKAREYLEKIIQLPFILPPIEDEAMQGYVESLAPVLPDPRCAEVFAQGLTPNPRQVKRTLNIYLLLSRLVERRAALTRAVTPVRLAKFVAIQHAHPDLYALLRLRPGYLRELEAFFRAGDEGGRRGMGEEGLPRLPEALQPFQSREVLRRLLCLFEDEDARFDGLTPLEVRTYLTLARRAVPVEAPAVHLARLPFEPELVLVPGGPFLMGTSDAQVQAMPEGFEWAREFQERKWFDDEQPQHELTLPPFEIGRYPVTNAEYAAFVEASGHAAPRHWCDGRLPEELADHPVVNVTWHDALAYVAWLRERTEQPYRLPAEAEWEKAARGSVPSAGGGDSGGAGRLWPWGNDWDPARANCRPAGPGATTPVGQYSPASDSPCGAADMAGNVWEWCSSLWGEDASKPSFGYPYRADDGRENLEAGGLRILRGGSWGNDNPGVVRCAYRNRSTPSYWNDVDGFRVARGSLP